ncbi:MAG: cyanophycin synthetase, partial [Parcubacteria group bacterium]
DVKKLTSEDELGLYRKHNLCDIMAAIGASFVYGVKFDKMKKAILKTNMISHRIEFVEEIKGVKYYNDSAATIPQSAIAALKSFKEPIILIAGGSDKKLEFSEFGKVIAERVKGVVFLKGSATEKLINEIKKYVPERDHANFEIMESMNKAVEFAARSADRGDIVLLSPGAASFGIFENEFDRGDKFKQSVRKLR